MFSELPEYFFPLDLQEGKCRHLHGQRNHDNTHPLAHTHTRERGMGRERGIGRGIERETL